jgi:hypothetical protein
MYHFFILLNSFYICYNYKYIPYKKLTTELCKLAILRNVATIRCFPSEFQTQEICNIVAEQNYAELINLIDKKYKTSEMYVSVIKKDGNSLKYVSKELQTGKIYDLGKIASSHEVFIIF